MKFTALAVTTLVAVAGVASANDYQPALRALAVPEPAAPNAVAPAAAAAVEHNAQPAAANAPANAAGKEPANVSTEDKKRRRTNGGAADSDGEARGEASEAAVVAGVDAADGVVVVAGVASGLGRLGMVECHLHHRADTHAVSAGRPATILTETLARPGTDLLLWLRARRRIAAIRSTGVTLVRSSPMLPTLSSVP
ncbi:hypothetical protein Pcac1_g27133 [Phytophthora cactorum]|nr:hypothetical protein Pcac1_g27133 [Phytophthora cactorum]